LLGLVRIEFPVGARAFKGVDGTVLLDRSRSFRAGSLVLLGRSRLGGGGGFGISRLALLGCFGLLGGSDFGRSRGCRADALVCVAQVRRVVGARTFGRFDNIIMHYLFMLGNIG
jgi:hypothetical protein